MKIDKNAKRKVAVCLLLCTFWSVGAQSQSTVTFDLNYPGAENSVAPISVPTGNAMPLDQKPVPTREGYRFAGWYADTDCTPTNQWLFGKKGGGFWGAASDSMAVTQNFTLYARWTTPIGISTPEA